MTLIKEEEYKGFTLKLFKTNVDLILKLFKDNALVPYNFSVSIDSYDALPYKEEEYDDIFQGGRTAVDTALGHDLKFKVVYGYYVDDTYYSDELVYTSDKKLTIEDAGKLVKQTRERQLGKENILIVVRSQERQI